MATAVPTRRPILAPPTVRYSLLGWLRKNLFGSLADTILTLVALGLLYLILRPLLTWLFTTSWAVIPANFTLILRGSFRLKRWGGCGLRSMCSVVLLALAGASGLSECNRQR